MTHISNSDAVRRLSAVIEDFIQQFSAHQRDQIPQGFTEPVVELDFSRNQLTRQNRRPIPLAHALFVRMLEQLARRPVLSVARFLLLPRYKRSSTISDHCSPSRALDHELAELRRKIEELLLPIEISRDGPAIRACFDIDHLRVNIFEAQLLAKKGAAHLASANFGDAIESAKRALAADFDCGAATWLLSKVLHVATDDFTADLVVTAETSLARRMLSLASAVQRLPKRATSHSPDVAKALRMAKRTLSRLRRQWLAFRSWPFDAAQQNEKMEDYRRSLRELMEVVIDARCGMPIRFTHFAQNSIVAELVEHLLAGRMRETDSRKRGSVIRTLKVEIFSKFVLSGWLPTPTASQRDFQRQLGLFLKARRIDWPKVLNRGSRRTSSFRDELHEVDDDTEDEG